MGIGDLSLGTIGTGLGAITSIGGGIFSAITGSEDASKITGIEKQMAGNELQQNAVRRNAMELASRRQSMQNVRQAQYARSMSMQAATSQGSQFGSDVGGAIGSISGQAGVNELGYSQTLQTGERMFQLTDQLSGLKMALADAQGKASEDSAIGKMIGGVGGSLGSLGKIGSSIPGIMATLAR